MKIIISCTKKSVTTASAIFILIIASGVILVWRAPTPPQTQPTARATVATPPITQPENDVDVAVTHDATSSATNHAFTVALNTHSGDLSTYDAQTNIVYRASNKQEVSPASVGDDRETHHRTITVAFTNTSLPGTLVIKNLRGVPERSFPITQ